VEASLSHRNSHIADLAEWLTAELGDPADAAAFARFVQDDVLTWRPPAADATSFRTLLAFTFGNRMESNGNRAPGPVNEAIAAVAAEVQRRSSAVVYASGRLPSLSRDFCREQPSSPFTPTGMPGLNPSISVH
jgi:hypothetical protein